MEELRFPIGRFQVEGPIGEQQRREWIADVAAAPAHLRLAVAGLQPDQLETPYRPGGWTVRQVVHHVADSHMNSYVRFKLALTEEKPVIKGYDEARWAELTDGRTEPVAVSLALLDALHQRWVTLLQSLEPAAWERTFVHPDLGELRLDRTLGVYSWHGRHHVAHITALRRRMGW